MDGEVGGIGRGDKSVVCYMCRRASCFGELTRTVTDDAPGQTDCRCMSMYVDVCRCDGSLPVVLPTGLLLRSLLASAQPGRHGLARVEQAIRPPSPSPSSSNRIAGTVSQCVLVPFDGRISSRFDVL